MDALVNMLMTQYKIPRAQAEQYAADIHSRATIDKTKVDSREAYELKQEDALQTEAYTPVVEEATQHLDNMRFKLEAFTNMRAKKARGESLTPANEKWYQSVDKANRDIHQAKVRENAANGSKFAEQDRAKRQRLLQMTANRRSAPQQPIGQASPVYDSQAPQASLDFDTIQVKSMPQAPQPSLDFNTAQVMNAPQGTGWTPAASPEQLAQIQKMMAMTNQGQR